MASHADVHSFPFGEVERLECFAEQADGVVICDGLVERGSKQNDLIPVHR